MANQKGFALMAALLVMLVGSIMVAAMMPLVTNELRWSVDNSDSVAAKYAAESGAKRAVAMFYQTTQDWGWLDANKDTPTWYDLTNKATEQYHVRISSEENGDSATMSTPASAGTYYVISTGKVNDATRTVSAVVEVEGGGGENDVNSGNAGVFSNYTVYSDEGISNMNGSPQVIGDVGSNGNISVWSCSSGAVVGTAYSKYTPGGDYTQVFTGGYEKRDSAGILDVASLMPTMPTTSASGTDLASVTDSILPGGYYYYSGKKEYTLTRPLTVQSGQSVVIYIGNDLHLTNVSNSYGSITGDEITIYVDGDILLDGVCYVQGSDIKIYATGTMHLTNDTYINGDNIMIQTKGDIDFNSNSSINKDLSDGMTKIYSNGDIDLQGYFKIGGIANMAVTTKTIDARNNLLANNAILIANGSSEVNGSAQIGGIYTNGDLNINGSPKINYSDQLDSILQALGLVGSGPGSPVINVTSWSR